MWYAHSHNTFINAPSGNDEQLECLSSSEDDALAALCLVLPGSVLYLTPLLNAKKFSKHNAKKDAVARAFYKLEEEGFGKTIVLGLSLIHI